ncbi:Chromosome partition protein MukB [Frankliniella fusca]|uniref:Chromosome partition protein MukB n=1 Tax=Frankliniella fusca TaxID=407009 RepID=A0AAE1HEH7_9NEOP|nr:Chromosome partition protein MukB [Frankliniella fusca]
MRVICERGIVSEILNSKLFTQNVGLDSIMAVTNGEKIAKLEAKVASLRLQYNFLNDHIKMITGKNPTLEAKVKAVMDWNQNLQLKVLGEVDALRSHELAAQDCQGDHKEASGGKEMKS